MVEQDVYTKVLSTILNELENIYGLKEINAKGTRKLCDLNIEDCLLQLKDSISHSTKETRKNNDRKVILSQIDAKTAKMRNAMGYRFLRIFIVILLNGNISHASVIADFILNQFIIEE